jgi:ABC-2 type transport system permease protein
MRRFLAVIRKEFRQIGRDPLSLGLLVGVPALLLLLYGYALTFDVKHIAMGVLDEDGTPASRELLDAMLRNPYFERASTLSGRREVDEHLMRGDVRAVMIVPRGYARSLLRGETARVQVLVDGADATSAKTVEGYLQALGERVTQFVRRRASVGTAGVEGPAIAMDVAPPRTDIVAAVSPVRQGADFQWSGVSGFVPTGMSGSRMRVAGEGLPMVLVEPRIWYNPEMESGKFLVPGLIGMLLMLSCVIAASLSIVREKERQTMEQMMVSPLRPVEFVFGKTLPYVLIGLGTMVMIMAVGYVFFGVAVKGSYLLLGISTLLFLVAVLGMGVLISSVTDSQQVAFQVGVIASLLPSLILSGFIFPIGNMPWPIQAVTFLVPPRYFVSAIRAVILKDATFVMIWPNLAALLVLGVMFNLLALRNTRKTM